MMTTAATIEEGAGARPEVVARRPSRPMRESHDAETNSHTDRSRHASRRQTSAERLGETATTPIYEYLPQWHPGSIWAPSFDITLDASLNHCPRGFGNPARPLADHPPTC